MEKKFEIVNFVVDAMEKYRNLTNNIRPMYTNQYAFKNLETGKICDERFGWITTNSQGEIDFLGDWVAVVYEGKYTFFNPSTGTLNKQRFNKVLKYDNGLCIVLEDHDGLYYDYATERIYNIEEDYVFWKSFPFEGRFENVSAYVIKALEIHPEDFAHLPSAWFKDKELINKCIGAIAKNIQGKYIHHVPNEEIIQYAKDIQKLIADKLAKENFTLEDGSKNEFDDLIYSIEATGGELE